MSASVQLSAAAEVDQDLHQHSDPHTQADEKHAEELSAPSTIPPVDYDGGLAVPSPALNHERWNQSPRNMYRFFTTLLCFILMGANDGAVGVSLAARLVGVMLLMICRP